MQNYTPTGSINRRGPFRIGERVQLTDERGKISTITLAAGGEYHSHRGYFKHDELIGAPEGTVIENSEGLKIHQPPGNTQNVALIDQSVKQKT